MSFRCKGCNKHDTGQPVRTIVAASPLRHPPRFAETESGKQGRQIDRGGFGTKIDREVDLCESCAGGVEVTVDGVKYANLGTTSIRTIVPPPVLALVGSVGGVL